MALHWSNESRNSFDIGALLIVYSLLFPNGKRYIGVTGQFKRRLRDHSKANTLVGRAIRKYGLEGVIAHVCFEGSSEECFEEERRLVEAYNTLSPLGYNQTAGGIGGLSPTKEVRENRSKALKRSWEDPETRERQLSYWRSPEGKARRSELAKARWGDPEKRAALMAARTKPEALERRSKSMTEVQSRPEVIEKKRAAAQKQWDSPDSRERLLRGMRG